MDDSQFSNPFSVACPRCGGRFEPKLRATFYFAKCPNCSEPVRVPAQGELEHDRAEWDAGDTYRIAQPTDWKESSEEVYFAPLPDSAEESNETRPAPKSPPDRRKEPPPQQPPSPPSAGFRVSCLACGAGFEATPSEEPQVVLCPECLEDVHVPPAKSWPTAPPAKETAAPAAQAPEPHPSEDNEPETFRLAWDPEQEEMSKSAVVSPIEKPRKRRRKRPDGEPAKNRGREVKESQAAQQAVTEIRKKEEDAPPDWTRYLGVGGFLFHSEVLVRWLWTSLGVALTGWLCGLVWIYYSAGSWLAMPLLLVPLLVIGIMTLSFAAANSMAILLETSAGNETVEGWPESGFKEQGADLIYLGFLLIATEVLSFFLGSVLSILIGPAWLMSLVLLYLLYPIVLLSSLEASSPFVPLTLPILMSLKYSTRAWAVFYASSFALMMVWAVPLYLWFGGNGGSTLLLMVFVGPLMAGWCYLYARMLGGLAWRISLDFPDEDEEPKAPEAQRKTKNQAPGVSESSGELQITR